MGSSVGAVMRLQPPPASLSGFPARRVTTSLRTLYRICWNFDLHHKIVRSPWRFSAVPPGYGRFDLPTPSGTCYWSDTRYGAWVEVWRGVRRVNLADAQKRRLWTGQAPAMHLANVLSRKAYGYGVTAAISTQPDYGLPQRWAHALHQRGFEGIVGSCSHDPTSQALNIAVFGHEGMPMTQPGWQSVPTRIEQDTVLIAELASFGVDLTPVPYDVPTIPPTVE